MTEESFDQVQPRCAGRREARRCRPSQSGVTRYTLSSSPRRPRGSAHKITHILLNTLRCSRRIGSSWSWQVTGVPARVLSSGDMCGISSTFNRKVKELASSRASTTRQALPSPSSCPNVSSGVIAKDHPAGAKPPDPAGNSEEPIFPAHQRLISS